MQSLLNENAEIKFDNPFDQTYYKWAMYGLLIILIFSLLVTLFTQKIGFFIAGILVVLLGYVVDWYAHDYSKPKQVIIYSDGVELLFRKKMPIKMKWSNVRGIFRRPSSDAVCKAAVRFYKGRPTEVTLEIADAIENGYLKATGTRVREWDGVRQFGD